MYSFQPLVDTSYNDHTGFYLILLLMVTISFYVLRGLYLRGVIVWLVFASAVVGFTWWVSYTQDEVIYANKQVVGEFVSMNPEVVIERSGKQGTREVPRMWVTYRVDNKMVVLPAKAGAEYPVRVILYKN